MPIKVIRNNGSGSRNKSVNAYTEITRSKPEKALVSGKRAASGRNNQGRKTINNRGGGHKKRLRSVDFSRLDRMNIEGRVDSIEYDPNRNAYIMLVVYKDGAKRYHLAPEKIEVGTTILTTKKTKARPGNRMMVDSLPVGFPIYNIELQPGKGGQIVRSAGSSATLVSLDGQYAQVQLPSGEVRFVHKNCYATVGTVSNSTIALVRRGKAGVNRWRGKKPHVRGKAKNPCDHPHGGGEGGAPIGMKHPKTPWGMPALGFKTRKRKSTNRWIVKTRKGKSVVNL